MGAFFAYSIQSALCLTLFYLFYKVLLSRETFHRFNRGALLGILAFASVIPVALAYVSFHDLFAFKSAGRLFPDELERMVEVFPSDVYVTDGNQAGNAGIWSVFLWVYLAGCAACLLFMIASSLHIVRIIRKGTCVSRENGIRMILSDDKQPSFSWMHYVVISRSDYEEAGETILAHETAHIRLHHTLDLVIAQACIVTQWFNPAAWLLYQELHHIHEFEADEAVIRQGVDMRQYQLLLIKKAVGTRLYSMANSFNHSNLKKRITMMLQKKSKAWARLKYAYVLPLAATTLVVFAHPKVSRQFEEISTAKVNHFALETSGNEVEFLPEVERVVFNDDSIYIEIEVMPVFPGGQEALLKYITEHLVYSPIAAQNGIQGRVTCTFVVEKDGSVTNVEVTKPVDPLLDKEAVRVLSTLPKFTPGTHKGKTVRVLYTVPVRFRLAEAKSAKETVTSPPEKEDGQVTVVAFNAQKKEAPASPSENEPILEPGTDMYRRVEYMPQYPGGEKKLLEDIAATIRYPKVAAENGIQGRVTCSFLVEKDGSISNVKVVAPVDPLLDAEAIRVIQSLPNKFKPGTEKGEAVRVFFNVPVRFRLTKKTEEVQTN